MVSGSTKLVETQRVGGCTLYSCREVLVREVKVPCGIRRRFNIRDTMLAVECRGNLLRSHKVLETAEIKSKNKVKTSGLAHILNVS